MIRSNIPKGPVDCWVQIIREKEENSKDQARKSPILVASALWRQELIEAHSVMCGNK